MKSLHLFCGMGGDALGFAQAGFEVTGIDADAAACRDFEYLTGRKAHQADLGKLLPDELRTLVGPRPDVLCTSPPCKGNSGCLPAEMAATAKYQEMNALSLRGIWLVLEAWSTPPPIVLLENVPRIQSRGKEFLRQIMGLLRAYGYVAKETTHDCGELGGLAQHRRRFLLIARHVEQVKEFVYVPPIQRVKGVGEVLGELPVPVPGPHEGGRLHELPQLSALNWVRLALIPAGGDWRDLPPEVAIGTPEETHFGKYGVEDWAEPAHTVIGEARTGKGWAGTADPRLENEPFNGTWGVDDWAEPAGTVTASHEPRLKPASVSDPRLNDRAARQNGPWGVNDWDDPARAVVGHADLRGPWAQVADPRIDCAPRAGVYGVIDGGEASGAVVASAGPDNGAWSVSDPRVACRRREGGHGVKGWADPSTTVIAEPCIDNGPWQVADPRVLTERRQGCVGVQDWDEPSRTIIAGLRVQSTKLQVADPRCTYESRRGAYGVTGWAEATHAVIAAARAYQGQSVADPRVPTIIGPSIDLEEKRAIWLVIRAADGTWHRPLTTLELAVLQGFPARMNDGWLTLDGKSHAGWRSRIGNAIPPPAAEAIARSCMATLKAAAEGGFLMSSEAVWVRRDAELRA